MSNEETVKSTEKKATSPSKVDDVAHDSLGDVEEQLATA